MLTEDYRVRLDAFEGPLDLLLFLIRKHEVDIHDIPVAAITEQYLDFLGEVKTQGPGRVDIDTAGEFLVMAATLMEIKSRMLMGRTGPSRGAPGEPAPAVDPRADLVRQLLEYKQFRDAAAALEAREQEWRRRFPAAPAGVDDAVLRRAAEAAAEIEMEDLDLMDLVEAFARISEAVNFDRLGEHHVTYDDTPLELHAEDILDRLRSEEHQPTLAGVPAQRAGELSLGAIFRGRTRGEMVGLFIALLELVRRRAVAFRQEDGSIFLRRRRPEELAGTPAEGGTQAGTGEAPGG